MCVVFDSATCKLLAKRVFGDGGVGLIQIIGRTNIIPLVGGGRKPIQSQRKVGTASFLSLSDLPVFTLLY